jgi:hypothetical protein
MTGRLQITLWRMLTLTTAACVVLALLRVAPPNDGFGTVVAAYVTVSAAVVRGC